jgi:hypothetical protein
VTTSFEGLINALIFILYEATGYTRFTSCVIYSRTTQLHTVPTAPSNFLKIHLKLFSHLRLGLPNGLFPSGFPTNTLCTPLSSPICATCPAHLIRLDFTTRTILCKEYRSFSSSLCSFLYSPVNSSFLGPNTLLNTLFSNTLSLHSSLIVSDQVLHPYKTCDIENQNARRTTPQLGCAPQ